MRAINRIVSRILITFIICNTIIIYCPSIAKGYSNIIFKSMTIEDGLSQSTVETIFQDSKGYMWIGTHDGLNRYNGNSFKVYRYREGDKDSIASNTIITIDEDKYGNLWVGTARGLSKINIYDNKIINYYDKSDKGNLSHYNICDILIRDSGEVLVATADGLNLYNEEEDKFERILEGKNTLTDQVIYSLDEDEFGNIWIGTGTGINKVDIERNKVEKINLSESINIEDSIYRVYCDRSGSVWIGTFSSGLLKINIKNNDIKRFIAEKGDKEKLQGNFVKDILKDSEDNIWVCTDKGLSLYDEDNDRFYTYGNSPYDRYSIIDSNTFSIFEDKSGLIWVGTYSGISTFDSNNIVTHYRYDIFDENSLVDNSVYGVYEDEDGLIWSGSSGKGLSIIDREKEKVIKLSSEKYDFLDEKINYIIGKENYIWVAANNGLIKIDKEKKSMELFNTDNGLKSKRVNTLFIDDNYLWIGMPDGINILNTKDNSITDISEVLEKNGVTDTYISSIYKDSNGSYWVGSYFDGGITNINPHDKTVKNYRNNIGDNNTISSNSILCIVEDSNKNLWIGTDYGLNKFDKKSNKFYRYTEKDGLLNDNIYGILIDDYENIWVSTNYGISKFDVDKGVFSSFNIFNGLQSNEFNGNSYWKSKNGELIFGGINGLDIFNPIEFASLTYHSEVEFDEFSIMGIISNNIENSTLDWYNNNLKFKIFMSDYRFKNKIKYYYKLDGVDEFWNETYDSEIIYNNLEPGKYKLRVKGKNCNGEMTEENSVSFTIKPPIWRRKESLFFYLLGIILCLYLHRKKVKKLDNIIKIRTKQLTEKAEANVLLSKKLIEAEKNKNKWFVNLSHELRTPLNVISSTEQLILALNKNDDGIKKEKLEYYIEIIKRNSNRLLRLINNIIDTAKMDEGKYELKVKDTDIVYIVEEAVLSLKDYIESKGITLVINPYIEEKIIRCDYDEIERCIINLVSNAGKFTSKDGEIVVTIEDLVTMVKISVKDNGVGIDEEHQKYIFNRFSQGTLKEGSGLGLTITKQIIEMHGGKIFVKSKLGVGSEFIILLPV